MTDAAAAITNRGLFANRSFLNLWLVGALTSTARWLDALVIGIFVFDQTASPFLVASMLLLRMLPLALFGIFGGAIADRFDRRRVLIAGMAALSVIAATLAALAHAGELAVWHVAVGAFGSGMVWATDFPVRRTLVSEIVGALRIGKAMSLDTVASTGTRMLGPLLGGALFASVGLDGAFVLSALTYGLALALLTRLEVPSADGPTPGDNPAAPAPAPARPHIRDGLARLKEDRILVGILVVTVIFNVWGFPFISLIPVFGKDILGLDPFAVGLLASSEGLGAFIGAVWLATRARTEHFRYLYFYGVVVYLVIALGFAQSSLAWLSGVLLLAGGIASAAFAAMQSALVLLNAPVAARPQMMGILSVCIGTGPIGFVHLGLMANWLGAPLACTIVAVEGLIAMAWVAWRWTAIISPQPVPVD